MPAAAAFRHLGSSLVAGSLVALAGCAVTTPTQDASPALARASQAMGTAQLKTLRYTAEGTGYTFGQAYEPGGAWPRIALHSVTRSIDYAIVLSGEIDMLLDETEVHLKAGDVLVQRGTNHAWVNNGGQTCRIAFILIDAMESTP